MLLEERSGVQVTNLPTVVLLRRDLLLIGPSLPPGAWRSARRYSSDTRGGFGPVFRSPRLSLRSLAVWAIRSCALRSSGPILERRCVR